MQVHKWFVSVHLEVQVCSSVYSLTSSGLLREEEEGINRGLYKHNKQSINDIFTIQIIKKPKLDLTCYLAQSIAASGQVSCSPHLWCLS